MYKNRILKKTNLADLIRYERERSERTNIPFSLIYVDLSKISEGTNGQYFKKVIKIIASSIRTIDRIGWIEDTVIGIVLPHTSVNGAKVLTEKLKKKLHASLRQKDLPVDFIVSSYPEINDYLEKHTYSKVGKIRTDPKSKILKMEYSHTPQMSDTIPIDSSLIFDLENNALRFDWQLVVKRMIDILGALVGILIFSPLILTTAAAIRLTSKGPALFRQERLGYQGKKFTFLKFRSMHVDNDESVHRKYVGQLIQGNHKEINTGASDRPYYKIKNDTRITPLGRILRKTSLDELPQLFNVLIGQMSLVGPRPPIPYETSNYQNWHKKRVLNMKPGITGLWQVKGRSQTTFDEMVRLDLRYAKNWSLWLDFKILFSTLKAVFSCRGAA